MFHFQCCATKELRQLYMFLIRRFDPSVQSRQFLQDLICGNHSLLVMIESAENSTENPELMTEHLKQFASMDIMRQYGHLMEAYETNSDSVNDAIFTMMHHISGDLQRPEALFVPQILKAFSDIWEQEHNKICEDWADLIEYVIQKFIGTMGAKPHAYASSLMECLDNNDALDENGFSKPQLDNLYYYFSQVEHTEDPVGRIIDMYKATSSVSKTRLSVIQALLSQGIITHAQYMCLMYMKSVLSCKPYHEGSVVAEAGSEHCDSEGHDGDLERGDQLDLPPKQHHKHRDQVEVLKELLIKQGKEYLIQWLQQILLDTCQVKLSSSYIVTEDGQVQEPIPFYFNCK